MSEKKKNEKPNMPVAVKKTARDRILAALLGIVLCAGLFAGLSFFLSGCGAGQDAGSGAGAETGQSSGQDQTADDGQEESGQGAAYKYVKLLADKDSTYYMKAVVESKVTEENAVTKDIVESAQTKDKQMISSESNSYIQYFLSGKQYYYDTLTMKYYELASTGTGEMVDQAYAPITGYKETKDAEFGGLACKCDIYENEAVYDGTKVLTTMEYYVAAEDVRRSVDGEVKQISKGDLVGIVSKQRYRKDTKLISSVTMTILEFTTDLPDGIFDPPSGFEKAD